MSDTPSIQQIIDGSSHCVVEDGARKVHSAVKAKISDLRLVERELTALRAKLAAAEKDAERLDLIERTGCYPFKSGSMWTFIIAEQNSSKIQARGTGQTARAAIDAAIEKERGK